MTKRKDLKTDFEEDAEEAIADLEFKDWYDEELKENMFKLLEDYNERLDVRDFKKKILFQNDLIENDFMAGEDREKFKDVYA